MVVIPEFSTWLKAEMQARAIGVRDLSRMAKLSPAAISNVLNQYRSAGPEFCHKIAHAFRLPEEEVFRRAGLLQNKPPIIVELYTQLDLAQQKHILNEIREMLAANEYRQSLEKTKP